MPKSQCEKRAVMSRHRRPNRFATSFIALLLLLQLGLGGALTASARQQSDDEREVNNQRGQSGREREDRRARRDSGSKLSERLRGHALNGSRNGRGESKSFFNSTGR